MGVVGPVVTAEPVRLEAANMVIFEKLQRSSK